MSNTKNSFSSLIAQFLRLQKNSLEIINKLNDVATSSKDSVQIEFLMDDNTSENIQIPSYGFLKSEINRIDKNVLALSGLEDTTANIRKSDGTVSKIYQANILKDPSSPGSLQVPGTFQARNNWFFESFLNPLLYISIDVENQIPSNSEKVYVKRIIANTQTEVIAKVNEAIKSSSVLSLSDSKGREILVPFNKISYVEVGESADRHVGFANQ